MANQQSVKRKDKKGRILKTGESVCKDGRYRFKYVGADGKPKFEYSWRLESKDPLPKGKRPCIPLREKEKEIQRDIMDGIDTTGRKMTVCGLLTKHNALNPVVRESSKKGREQLLKRLQDDKMGNMAVEKVKPSDTKEWAIRMKEKGYAYQTIYNNKRSLSDAFYTAVKDDLIRKNPFDWDLKEVIENDTELKTALTEEQTKALLSFLQTDDTYHKYYNAVVVLLNTGIRISELCGLTVEDVDFENGYITVDHQLLFDNGRYRVEQPKTDSGVRKIPMNESARKALEREMLDRENVQPMLIDSHTDFVFLNTKGLPMYGTAYSTLFQRMVKKYNKHHKEKLPTISPHTLRHTFCTDMAIKNLPPKVLQYVMGHKNITTTLGYYAHGSAESAKKAMESLTA